jgi:predicted nucleic-acid-binding protein
VVEDGEPVDESLEAARSGTDFGDALIDATSHLYGVTETVTFDRDAAERFGGRSLA